MKSGKSYVRLLMKNTKWNDYGILVVRIGLTNINIVGAVKHFVAYMRKVIGFMIIFGKDERTKFEDIRTTLSNAVCRQYDEAKIYHDGKWVMFEPTDTAVLDDYIKLLAIKRKPNRK